MQRRYQPLMKYWEIIADHLSKAGLHVGDITSDWLGWLRAFQSGRPPQ
jgi:hypothetical protein